MPYSPYPSCAPIQIRASALARPRQPDRPRIRHPTGTRARGTAVQEPQFLEHTTRAGIHRDGARSEARRAAPHLAEQLLHALPHPQLDRELPQLIEIVEEYGMGHADHVRGNTDRVAVQLDEAETALGADIAQKPGHPTVHARDHRVPQGRLPRRIGPDPREHDRRHGQRTPSTARHHSGTRVHAVPATRTTAPARRQPDRPSNRPERTSAAAPSHCGRPPCPPPGQLHSPPAATHHALFPRCSGRPPNRRHADETRQRQRTVTSGRDPRRPQ